MNDYSFILTLVFAATLVLGLLVKFYLASRQIRHVMQHRDQVPAAFANTITLESHRKAADYTVAKTRFGLLQMAFASAVLLGWTLIGGLDTLNQAIGGWGLNAYGALVPQLALLAAFAVIGGVLDLPFTLYSTFRIEERFGFNKMTLKLWLADLVKATLVGAAVGLPVVALILWLMGSAGSLWWLWAWSAWMGFNLLALVLYPTVIAPLFNKFKPQCDFVEAETLFEPKGVVQRERQVEQAADQAEQGQQSQLRRQAAVAHQRRIRQCLVQSIDAAQQRPAEQHGGCESHFKQAETRLGDGVVGRLLVRSQRDRRCERGRHLAPVQRHMADLPRRQIKARCEPERQQGGKQQGESERRVGHGGKFRPSARMPGC